MQRCIELGQTQCLARIAGLHFAVEDPLRHAVAHQLVQHLALRVQHLRAERIVDGCRRKSDVVDVVAIEPVDLDAAHELGLEAEAVDAEKPVGNDLERFALLRRIDRRQR